MPTAHATVRDSNGLVVGIDEGEKLVRRWGYPFLIKLDEKNGGATQFVVGWERIPPGRGIHVHRHDHAEEILIIKSGNGTAIAGERRFPVGPGSLIFIPQHGWAGFENTGDEDIELFWVFPKPGIEKYFRDTSVPAGKTPPTLSEEEHKRLRALHKEFVVFKDEQLPHYTAHRS